MADNGASSRNLLGALISSFGCCLLALSSFFIDLRNFGEVATVLSVATLLLAIGVAWSAALRERTFVSDRHEHVSGWSVLLASILIASVWSLGVWASGADVIDTRISLSVLGLVVAIFAVTALGSDLITRAPRIYIPVSQSLGRAVSLADSFAVFVLAPLAGARIRSPTARYTLGLVTMASCGASAFALPPPWGLAPFAWALLLTAGVIRRWAWVEEDRDAFVRYGDMSRLRVGFEQNLLDEALLMTLLFFLLIPMAYLQLDGAWQLGGRTLFSTPSNVGLMDWYQFFGSELTKAAPLLDWAEVYNVRGNSDIVASSPASHHVVFATRALLDVVLFGVLLQAVATLRRNQARQQILFEGYVGRVDPFVERNLLYPLVRRVGSDWVVNDHLISDFPVYDEDRLEELALSADRRLESAAKALLARARNGT